MFPPIILDLFDRLRRLRLRPDLSVDARAPLHPPAVTPAARALARAEAEWRSVVREPAGEAPNGAARIDRYIRGSDGLGWGSADADNLDEPVPYAHNGQFQWCGAFAAYCWAAGGLRRRIRRDHMASCYKLHTWAGGTDRIVRPEDIQPGDVVIVGRQPGALIGRDAIGRPRYAPVWGEHITLARDAPADGYVPTWEGNAGGELGDGTQGEGVVRDRQPLAADDPQRYRVLYAIRFSGEDLET